VRREDLPFVGLLIVAVGITGFCATDCARSTPDFSEAVISDRRHVPGHYRQVCETEWIDFGELEVPITTCRQVWQEPTWTVWYRDQEGSYPVGVNEKLYEALWMGRTVYVTFKRTRYLGLRWSESFSVDMPTVEGK
jgi:hypothetical protein